MTLALLAWGLLGVRSAHAQYVGELYVELDTRAEALPTRVCLQGGKGVWLQGGNQKCTGPGELNLEVQADFGSSGEYAMSARRLSQDPARIVLHYESVRRPEVVTVGSPGSARTCEDENGYHAVPAVTWLPILGTRPVVLSVVPCSVWVELDFPEYQCLQGKKIATRERLQIDSEWRIQAGKAIEGCDSDGRAAGAALFRFPQDVSLKSAKAVPMVPIGMRIAWQPDPLSEARHVDDGVKLEADRDLQCADAKWRDDQKRFEWSCGASNLANAATPHRLEFPARVQLSVNQPKPLPGGIPHNWEVSLRFPGQVLTGYVEPAERTLLVKWDGWCQEEPYRAEWTMDQISGVEVQSTGATSLSLSPPTCSRKTADAEWRRESFPGLRYGERVRLNFWGDRTFRPRTVTVRECSRVVQNEELPTPNCLVLRPPEDQPAADGDGDGMGGSKDQNLRRDRTTLGVGLLGGLYGTGADGQRFYGPVTELHLNALFRGVARAWSSRWDLELRIVVSFQSWSAYRCRGSCNPDTRVATPGAEQFERAERQRDSMVAVGFQPGLRFSVSQDAFLGLHLFARYGAPPIRRGGSEQVPLQPNLGGGVSASWYLSRAVALELQGNLSSAQMRFVTLDPSGLVSNRVAGALEWSGILGIRFDDLAGD